MSSSSAAQSRRAKNAAHRADDVEFAFEIGSGLLPEIRRLQGLLGERDKAIQDMKEEKDDLEQSVEALRAALTQQEQSSVQVLCILPEELVSSKFAALIDSEEFMEHVCVLGIDEIHLLNTWGAGFRKKFRQIGFM